MADSGAEKNPETADDDRQADALPEMKPVGYFEGESMTRRKVFTVAGQALGGAAGAVIILPALGFAIAPIFDEPEEDWQRVGSTEDFTPTPTCRSSSRSSRASARPARRPSTSARGSVDLDEDPDELRRDLDPLRPPRLPGPLRPGRRQLHLPLPRRRLRLRGQGHRRPAGAPARPLPDPRRRRPVEIGPRYSVTSQLEPVRARDPGEFTGGIWEYLYPPRPSTAPAP